MAVPADGSPAPAPEPKRPRLGPLLLRLGATAAIFAVILSIVPLRDVTAAMARTGVPRWLAVAALFALGHTVSALKWRGLVRAAGVPLPVVDALRAHAAGLFANSWLPSIVGGDVVRAAWVARAHGLTAPAAAGLLDRVLDLLALLLLASIGLLGAGEAAGAAGGVLRAAALVLLLGLAAGVAAVFFLHADRVPSALEGPVTKLVAVRGELAGHPGAALRAFLLALVVQGSFVGLNAWIGAAIGIELPFAVWLLAWPLAKLAALAPVSLGGLGVREAALTALLAPFGALAADTVGQALVWQSVIFGVGLVAGGVALLGRRRA